MPGKGIDAGQVDITLGLRLRRETNSQREWAAVADIGDSRCEGYRLTVAVPITAGRYSEGLCPGRGGCDRAAQHVVRVIVIEVQVNRAAVAREDEGIAQGDVGVLG